MKLARTPPSRPLEGDSVARSTSTSKPGSCSTCTITSSTSSQNVDLTGMTASGCLFAVFLKASPAPMTRAMSPWWLCMRVDVSASASSVLGSPIIWPIA